MRNVMETLGGVWELFMLAVKSRFRMRNTYWRWRYDTAFGTRANQRITRWQRLRAMIDYGRWVHRMKRVAK